MGVDRAVAREVWRRLEPLHAVVYFAPEAAAALTAAGYRGFWMGYFAARAAPLGAAGPEVVHALFYNFTRERVAQALPDAWAFAGPDAALAARASGAGAALRRALSDAAIDPEGPQVTEAAELTAAAARTARPDGRTLYAANAALTWPTEPVDVLWHAATALREHRGDGHVATLVALGLSGRQSNVLQSLAGNVDAAMIMRARDYSSDEWSAIIAELTARGLVARNDLTVDGRALRDELEARTDAAAECGYHALGDDDIIRLIELLTPLARAVAATGDIPSSTPMGPTFGT